jgi:hypothetical protein
MQDVPGRKKSVRKFPLREGSDEPFPLFTPDLRLERDERFLGILSFLALFC